MTTLALALVPTVANIVAAFHAATPADHAAGRAWYREARELAAELDPSDVSRGAAVIAVLSPLTSWPQNVRLAREAYAGRRPRCLPASADKAMRLMAGEPVATVVSGAKVTEFYGAIMGDPNAVAVDRHAVAVAVGRVLSDAERSPFARGKGYAAVVAAYVDAARELGEGWTPAQVQAATWTWWRRNRALAYHKGEGS